MSGLESEQPKEKTVMAADIELGGTAAGSIERIVAPLPERFMVLDVETRRSAAEVGGWHRADLMGVSVAVLYDSKGDCFTEYEQEELPAMFERLREGWLGHRVQLVAFRLRGAAAVRRIRSAFLAHAGHARGSQKTAFLPCFS